MIVYCDEKREIWHAFPNFKIVFDFVLHAIYDKYMNKQNHDDAFAAKWIDACRTGNIQTMEEMAGTDAWPDIVYQRDTQHALSIAADHGHVEICKRLIAHQPFLEHRTDIGRTPLYRAASKGHDEIVQILLQAGADPMARNRNGSTPLIVACEHGHLKAARALIKRDPSSEHVNAVSDHGIGAMIVAAENNHPKILALLIESGADIDLVDRRMGITPLSQAVYNDHAACAQIMLEGGANPNFLDSSMEMGYLHVAVEHKSKQMAMVLLESGIDTEILNSRDQTARMMAHNTGWAEFDILFAEHQARKLSEDTQSVSGGGRRIRL